MIYFLVSVNWSKKGSPKLSENKKAENIWRKRESEKIQTWQFEGISCFVQVHPNEMHCVLMHCSKTICRHQDNCLSAWAWWDPNDLVHVITWNKWFVMQSSLCNGLETQLSTGWLLWASSNFFHMICTSNWFDLLITQNTGWIWLLVPLQASKWWTNRVPLPLRALLWSNYQQWWPRSLIFSYFLSVYTFFKWS